MKWILLSLLVGSTGYLSAQNEEDALRYSQESLGGTARNMGMAGAMTALGGDYSSTLKNPAATGRFSKSNFSFTTFVENNVTDANFLDNNLSTSITNLKVGNISYLKAYNLNPNKFNGWAGVQLGVGYNRKQSFNQSFTYSGLSTGSLVDYFIAEAGNSSPTFIQENNAYSSGLAYDNYLIDPYFTSSDSIDYYYSSGAVGASKHTRTVNTEGGMGEINFSLSGNYQNKLLIGGSLNIVTLNYNTNFIHNEVFTDSISWVNEFDYTGYIDANGTGVNARVGMIYTPVEFLRLGASIETPTRLVITEKSDNTIVNETDSDRYNYDSQPPLISEYIVRTPLKANFSIGLVHKKFGSLGAELEIVDYSTAKMKSNFDNPLFFYSYIDENNQIRNLYRSTINLRFGAEARLNEQLYVRGGYALYGSAYKAEKGVYDQAISTFTGGIGYNFGEVYLDFAAVMRTVGSEHIAYLPELEGSTSFIENNRKQFVLSLGYRF
ncbi:MAG: hypothetical protein R3279_11250 [Putridiphycobacter sp.]|nr:hypothetical protein [Putridiphycobacter sp.]